MRARCASMVWAFGLALALAAGLAASAGRIARADDSGGRGKDCSKLEPGSSKHARCLDQLKAADAASPCKGLEGDARKKCLKKADGGTGWACKGMEAASKAYTKCLKEQGRFAESDCKDLDKGSKAWKKCVDDRKLSDEAYASCKDRGVGSKAYRDCLEKEYGRKDVISACRDLGVRTVAYQDCLRGNIDQAAIKHCKRNGYASQAFEDCVYSWHAENNVWVPFARNSGAAMNAY